MIFIDEMKNMKIYKRPIFLPYNDSDKKHGSLVYLLTPNYQSSKKTMKLPFLINRRTFESYYMEKEVGYYIKKSKSIAESAMDKLLEDTNSIYKDLDFNSFTAYHLSTRTDEDEFQDDEEIDYYENIEDALKNQYLDGGSKYIVYTHTIDNNDPIRIGTIVVDMYDSNHWAWKWVDFTDFEIKDEIVQEADINKTPFYFYTLVPKNAEMDKGVVSLQWQYDHDKAAFHKNADKYRERLCNEWKIYPGKNPGKLTDEELIEGIRTYRHSTEGANQIYLFRYPPTPEMGPNMAKTLAGKDIYRIDLNDPAVKNQLVNIYWGTEGSYSDGEKLDINYYKRVTPDKYFEKYKDDEPIKFAGMNHISIEPKNGALSIKYWKKINLDSKLSEAVILDESIFDKNDVKYTLKEAKTKKEFDIFYKNNDLILEGESIGERNLQAYANIIYNDYHYKKEPIEFYFISASNINKIYDLEGSNSYNSIQTMLIIPLKYFRNQNDISKFKSIYQARFFNDVIDNNEYHEYEKGRHKASRQIQWLIDFYNESSINESIFFNEKDIYYNKEKFDSGEINICFITGHSGSGKSTMGRDMQSNNTEHYELDDLQCIADHFTMVQLKEYGDLIYSFFNKHKEFYLTYDELVNKKISGSDYEDKMYRDFVYYAINYAKSHKDRKFVIEGVWLFCDDENGAPYFKPEEFDNCAFYIKGTSMIIAKYRAAVRDAKEDNKNNVDIIRGFSKNFFLKNWKWYKINEKRINNFRNYFKSKIDNSKIIESNLHPDPVLNNIIQFNKELNNYEYIIPNNGDIITKISSEDFIYNYKLLSPNEFKKYHGGICWDYCVYEDHIFQKKFNNIKRKFFYVMFDNQGTNPTHTFMIFEYNKKYYWFESSWKSKIGLYEFDSEKDALNYIIYLLSADVSGMIKNVFYKEYKPSMIKSGVNCTEYMAIQSSGLKSININSKIPNYNQIYIGQILQEAYIKNETDLFYNKDRWESGEVNLLFCTGHSGSGKTTEAHKRAKKDIEIIEIDNLFSIYKFTDEQLKEYGDLTFSFFRKYKKYRYNTKDEKHEYLKMDENYYENLTVDFINYAISYAKSHPNNKYIIEGVWVFYFIKPEVLKDNAVLIKGTSAILSKFRAIKREILNKNFKRTWSDFKHAPQDIKDEKILIDYRRYFSEAEEGDSKSPGLPTAPVIKTASIDTAKDLKNLIRKIKMKGRQGLYKMNATAREASKQLPTVDDIQSAAKTAEAYDYRGLPENKDSYIQIDEYVQILEAMADSQLDSILRKNLYNDRIRKNKEVLLLYKKVKQDIPFIKYTFLDTSRYGNRNLFFDLSYYIEVLFNNIGILKNKKGIDIFTEFLQRLLNTQSVQEYKKKTIFIPITDWTQNPSTRMWLFKEVGANPISLIYDALIRKTDTCKKIFKNMDIIFLSSDKYFKINFSEIEDKDLNTLPIKFKTFITKILKSEPFNAEDEDDAPNIESKKVIMTNIVDKIQKIHKVDMSTQSQLIATLAKDNNKIIKPKAITGRPVAIDNEIKDDVDKSIEKRMDTITSNSIPKQSKIDKEKDIKKLEIIKASLVNDISNRANYAANTDDAIDKMEYDDEFKELILQIAAEEAPTKISKTRSLRMEKLQDVFTSSTVRGISVKDLLDEEKIKEKSNTPLKSTSLPVDSPFKEQWQNMKFINFDKTYNVDEDIIRIVNELSNKQFKIAIRNIDIKDGSTPQDYIDTWKVEMEDLRGKRFSITFDVPKFKDHKYLILRGNKKTIQNQYFNMPLLKTDLDTVQVISNYSKIFIRRFGSLSGKSITYADKLIKTARKYTGTKIKFEYGDNSKICDKYELPIDYIDLAGTFNKISYTIFPENHKVEIWFNQDQLYEKYKQDIDLTKGVPIGIVHKGNKTEIFYHYNNTAFSDTILMDLNDCDEKFKELSKTVVLAKRYTYSKASIMSTEIPLIIVCCLNEGLTSVLNKSKFIYKWQEKLTTDDRKSEIFDYIKFMDGYLIYRVNYESSLLLNGLKELNTEDYMIADMDKKNTWIEALDLYGGRIKADGLENFYECFIDPITKEILDHYQLPTDYVTLLIYANNLLSDNKYIPHGDSSSRRIRRNELIAAKAYKALFNDAYAKYANGMRHNPSTAQYNLKKSAIIDLFMNDPTTSDLSVLNVLNDIEASSSISTKGESGMNSERSYTLDKRVFDPSMLNLLAMSTGFSANVGVNRQATMNMNIDTNRGFIKSIDGDISKMNTASSLSATEAINVLGSTRDDPVRVAMTFVQTAKHNVVTDKSDPSLVTTGGDEVAPYLVSDIFCKKAEDAGKVISIDDKGMIIKYNNGKSEFINLSTQIEKNSDGGFYIETYLITDLKVGQSFKANQIIAYDPKSFDKGVAETNHYVYKMGKLAKIAILNADDNIEDSALVTQKLADALSTDIVLMQSKMLSKDTNIYNMCKLGQKVLQEDILFETQTAYDEEDVNQLLKSLAGDKDKISKLGRRPVTSPSAGTIAQIKLYRTCEISEMSESLQKLFKTYEADIHKQAKVLKDNGITDPTLLPSAQKLEPIGKMKNCPDSVLIEVYIRYHDIMALGDKLVYLSANKGVIHNIVPTDVAPYTDARPDEEVSGYSGISSINKRQIASNVIDGALNKLAIELGRQCREILGLPYYENELNL